MARREREKTAFSRWLGEKADMPVNIKRASDLKSKYVGENERNIAKAFVEAKSEHAILMFDEVDSFSFRAPQYLAQLGNQLH